MPDLTVAICTYRRPELLRFTLQSLAACSPPACQWELLVVDNEVADTTRLVVEDFIRRHPRHAVRYEPESALGASHARNRAILSARSPVVLFSDDDVTFDRHWLASMAQAIKTQPGCDLWGGRVEPVWKTPPPDWFDPRLCPMLGDTIVRYQQGLQPRPWNPDADPPFYTANLALKVDAVQQAGMFDTTVGHRGQVRIGGEDSLLVKALARQGSLGWYAADAVVFHPVPPERLSKTYARQFAWRQGWIALESLRQEAGGGNDPAWRPPRWLYRAAALGMLAGWWEALAGFASARPAHAFAGAIKARYNRSKLHHALLGTPARPPA